jgi:CobQ-like glutamine amidotransferase family enzyme/UDP-N-acetylmuramyl tripeptide synthase
MEPASTTARGDLGAAMLDRRARLAAGVVRLLGRLSRGLGLGEGSVIGGKAGLLIDHRLLAKLASGRQVALVSGTNGKTTTTAFLACALSALGEVATSRAGANMPQGLVAALAAAPWAPYAALEVDEGYLPSAIEALRPRVVVLTNLSRDQLDRTNEVRRLAHRWREAFRSSSAGEPSAGRVDEPSGSTRAAGGRPAHGLEGATGAGATGAGATGASEGWVPIVVANADDPLVAWAALAAPRAWFVGLGTTWRQDAAACPACGGVIDFFEAALGAREGSAGWRCRSCGLGRPEVVATATRDRLVTSTGECVEIALRMPGRFNAANAAQAAVAAHALGAPIGSSLRAIGKLEAVEGRFATVAAAGRTVRLVLAKNPAGFAEVLELLRPTSASVVVGINARDPDGHDPSWLYDVPFEELASPAVIATGERGLDLAVRLRYAGVAHALVRDQLAALAIAAGAERTEGAQEGAGQQAGGVEDAGLAEGLRADVVYIGNYTAFQELWRRIRRGRTTPRASWGGAVGSRLAPSGSGGRAEFLDRSPAASTSATGGQPDRSRVVRDRSSAFTVVLVYPELLGTYGDAGNATVLAARARWRGIPVEVVTVPLDQPLPLFGNLYLLGGGEDAPQALAAERLLGSGVRRGPLGAAVDRGALVFAVCAGFQILGTTFPGADGRPRDGLGLLDASTVRTGAARAVGELLVVPGPELRRRRRASSTSEGGALGDLEPGAPGPSSAAAGPGGSHADTTTAEASAPQPDAANGSTRLVATGEAHGSIPQFDKFDRVATAVAGLPFLTGFENHAGRTFLGPEARPLGRVLVGVGNGDGARSEGAIGAGVVATYLHGPVLARNPALADALIEVATGCELEPLDDEEEALLRAERLRALGWRTRRRLRALSRRADDQARRPRPRGARPARRAVVF